PCTCSAATAAPARPAPPKSTGRAPGRVRGRDPGPGPPPSPRRTGWRRTRRRSGAPADRPARPRPCARAGTPTARACPRARTTRPRAPSTKAPGAGRRSCLLQGVVRQPREPQLEQRLGREQALLDRLEHQVVGALAQQRGLVV